MAEDQVSQLIRDDELRDRLRLLNPAIPLDSIDEAVRMIRLVQRFYINRRLLKQTSVL